MELETKIQNYINAGSYENVCDYVITDINIPIDILYKDCIIFCKTDFIGHLFSALQYATKKYVIITHHSDYPIDTYLYSLKPHCVKKWYGINVTHTDNNLICIPLGLKTYKGIFLEEKYMTKWLIENIDDLKINTKQNVVYCNWTSTNPYRNTIIDMLKKNNIKYILEENLSFTDYAKNMSMCKYVISPPGNGIDCHRTWEALYMGCIPIVIKNSIYDNWGELPIIKVSDYSELTNDILNSFVIKKFNYEKLYMEYWSKKIKDSL